MDHYEMAEAVDNVPHELPGKVVQFLERILNDRPTLSQKQQQWIEDLYEQHVINRGMRL